MVYTAQSQSLAALEIVVHLDSSELLRQYVVIEVEIDETLIARVSLTELPANWRADPPPPAVRKIGDVWATEGRSAVLQAPSATVPAEHSFLLNPRHAAFPKLRIGKPSPFQFDPRLAGRR